MSLSPGSCGSHQVMLAPYVTWTSEVALGREAKLQRETLGSPARASFAVFILHKTRSVWHRFSQLRQHPDEEQAW